MGQAHRGPTGVALSLFPPLARPDHLVGTGEKSKPCTEAEQRRLARETGGYRPVPWRVGQPAVWADCSHCRERSNIERRSSVTEPVNPAVHAPTWARARACFGGRTGQWHNGPRFHGCPAFSGPSMAALPPSFTRSPRVGVARPSRPGRVRGLRVAVARVDADRAALSGSADRRAAPGRLGHPARPARDAAAASERASPRGPGGASRSGTARATGRGQAAGAHAAPGDTADASARPAASRDSAASGDAGATSTARGRARARACARSRPGADASPRAGPCAGSARAARSRDA